MPPLSAYTPFESLLFFQSLAALDARPANFASISDGLCNNRFVRENVAFDAARLAPEALEDLYSTLTQDGTDGAASVASRELNGRHDESPTAQNTKKRKISSPKPDGLAEKGMIGHARLLPEIVSHLYARYRELVTKEIRNEERKYNEIRDELESLKKEREAVPEPAPMPAAVQKPPSETPAAAHPPAPEPMDVDAPSEISTRHPPLDVAQSSAGPKPGPEIKQPPSEPPRKEIETPKQPTPITPRPPAQQKQQHQLQPMPVPSPAPPVKQSPKEQPKKTPSQPLPLKPYQQPPQQPPPHPQPTPQATAAQPFQVQPQPPNGQPSPASQPPTLAPRDIPTPQGTTIKPPLPPQIPSHSQPQPPTGVAPAPAATAAQPSPPIAKPPVPLAPTKTPQTAKAPGKEASSTASPKNPQPPPLQPTIQQWPLNQLPQTPHPPSSRKLEPSGQTPAGKPFPPPSSQQTPQPQPKQVPKPTVPASGPSTPLPAPAAAKPLGPAGYGTGYETPVAAAQALLQSQPRASLPRLSIDTSGSVTPWKKTPSLTLPHSPRSPDRPRPEDVSPISEKAPSLTGSREATPEEAAPPRRKRRLEAKGSSRGREPNPPAADADHRGGRKGKSEKLTLSATKRRDRSTASSRSRGRSVLSHETESAADPAGKIKREMPTTPAGVPDVAETEHRASGRKSAAPASEEPRPGRGRPKRKRAPSEAVEPELSQPDISQLSRIDPNQSTPYVLCARNFPKTGQAIMNNVTTHKHASVFSKPLTERDAPGYRDLIYRPQDLKSIKSSITQGSKALAAATEAVSTPVADGESPIPTSNTPSKNSVLMLQKSEDVIPPKGIVNSAQLEKELIRMFSNATMFNPIPQRGFGPAFPMMADGESRESTIVPEPDEGGIIKATHEMFEDVEKAVTGWRQAERTSDELASKSILSLRRGSASDFNTDSADEVKGS